MAHFMCPLRLAEMAGAAFVRRGVYQTARGCHEVCYPSRTADQAAGSGVTLPMSMYMPLRFGENPLSAAQQSLIGFGHGKSCGIQGTGGGYAY